MASAYSTALNRNYLFLVEAVKRYQGKIQEAQAVVWEIKSEYQLELIQLKIDNLASMKKQLDHSLLEIDSTVGSIQKLAEAGSEEYQKELSAIFDPIMNNVQYLDAHQMAKGQLLVIHELTETMKETEIKGRILLNSGNEKGNSAKSGAEASYEILQALQQSFAGVSSALCKGAALRSSTRLTLPTFDGKIENFSSYWGRFKRMIDENEDYETLEKVNLLCEGLSGEALAVIQGIEPSAQNYEQLKNILKEEFGSYVADKIQLVNNLKKVKKAKNNAEDCIKTLRQVKTIMRQIEAAGWTITPACCLFEITNKFPFHIIKQIMINESQNWTVEEIMTTITRNVKTLQMQEKSEVVCEEPLPTFEKRSDGNREERKPNTIAQKNNEGRKIWPCLFCDNTNHRSHQCQTIDTVDAKREILKKDNRCWICFSPLHKSKECKRDKCPNCKGDHNSSVCQKTKYESVKKERISSNIQVESNQTSSNIRVTPATEDHVVILSHTESDADDTKEQEQVLLRTAESKVWCHRTNQYQPVKVLIDEGSMRSFIKADMAEKLGLAHKNQKVRTYYGIGGLKSSSKSSEVQITFHTQDGNFIITKLITRPTLTESIRSPRLDNRDKNFLKNHQLVLANPKVNGESFEPDVILGMDRYRQFVKLNGEIELPSTLTLKDSVFGYLLNGCVLSTPLKETLVTYTVVDGNAEQKLNEYDMLKHIFDIDSLGINTEDHTIDQTNNYFQAYVKGLKLENRRITAPLPLKPNIKELKTNFHPSLYRLRSLWDKIKNDPEQLRWYTTTFNDYIQQGIIEEVPSGDQQDHQVFYLPHHGVWKMGKPKPLRIVFDGSAKQKGSPSLNETIHTGLSYVNKIHDILILARVKPIIITCDIESAFLQIALNKEHRDLCRFLWIKDPSQPITGRNVKEMRFKRLPFGLTASPSVLNMCLTWFLSNSELDIAKEILQCLYVDNIILFANTTDEASQKCRLVKELFKEISMNVRQYLCNNETITEKLPEIDKYPLKDINILGVPYKPTEDTIGVNLRTGALQSTTKRGLLRHLHSLYDPIGIINPLTVNLKVIFRKVCDEKYGWDEPLPEEIIQEWRGHMDDIQSKATIHIKRAFDYPIEETKLWVFADASATALACCAYLKYPPGVSYLLSGKTRLAPRNKTITIPRLELLAIRLACRMASTIQTLLPNLKEINIASDSTIALSWITNGKTLPPYVTHQVQEIQRSISSIEGRGTPTKLYHVETSKNPADLGSRGGNMKQLLESYWLYGPYWLGSARNQEKCQHIQEYPRVSIPHEVQLVQVEGETDPPLVYNLSYRESRYANLRILVVMGKVLRHWIRKVFPNKPITSEIENLSDEKPTLTQDLAVIERLLIKQAQYGLSIKELEAGHKGFDFFTDTKGIIRVKSRLQNAPIPYETKNPIFIPHNSPYTEHIVMHFHRETQHQGKDFVAIRLRQEYYVPKPAQLIKKVIKGCVICRRFHALPFGTPQMPSLPKDRVTISKPFLNTGCDLLGPLSLRENKKVYVCLFTCMTTRAIHLEVVLDQSAKAFMNAFNRFISRRGVPHMMRSDGAGNFTLSAKMLDIFERCNEKELSTEGLLSYFASQRIKWLFNTPLAPWKGGCWERLVGLTKLALKKAIGKKLLNADDFITLLIKIEAILNTRPLTHPDPNELNRLPIRPIDFLSPMLAFAIPDEHAHTRAYPDTTGAPMIQTMEQAIEAIQLSTDITTTFWEIFLKEYLLYIKDVYKHGRNHTPSAAQGPQEGEVVIIQEESLPRASWKLGRIMSLIKSSDNQIRSAKIKTGTGNIITRALNQVYSMEIKSIAPINPNPVKTYLGTYDTRSQRPESHQPTEKQYFTETTENSPSREDSDNIEPLIPDNLSLPSADARDDEIEIIEAPEQANDSAQDNQEQSQRWWVSERIRKNTLKLKRSRECPKWLKQTGKPMSVNKQLFMICCLILMKIDDTTASTDPCEGTHLFTENILANPHCSNTTAWATIMIPICIGAFIVACLCRLTRGEKVNRTWSSSIQTMKTSIQNRNKHTTSVKSEETPKNLEEGELEDTNSPHHSHLREQIRIPQYMRIGSRLSLLMIITTVVMMNVEACQQAHVRHSTNIICNNSTSCYKEYAKDFILSAGVKNVCLEYLYKNRSIGTIEILNSKTRYKCIPTVHFYTRQTEPKVKTRNRCSSMGSCNDACETIQSSIEVFDMTPYEHPSQTGCRRSCGFIGCGCLTWSDSCTFFKLEHVPKDQAVYQVMSCDSWKTEVELEIKTIFFGSQERRKVVIQPYQTVHEKLFNLTMISHTKPPIFGLHKEFAMSQNKTFMVEKDKIMINCQSREQALKNFKDCVVTKHCDCIVDQDNEAACHCPFHIFATKTNLLPFHPYEGTIKTEQQVVIIEPKFDEGKYTIESSMLLNGHLIMNDVACHISFISLTGCYNCQSGATLTIQCLSAIDTWIPLQCENEIYMTRCGQKEPINQINYPAQEAHISTVCASTCAGKAKNVRIEGTLHYTADNEAVKYDKSQGEKQSKIDLKPLWKFMTNWRLQAYSILLVVAVSLMVYLLSARAAYATLIMLAQLIAKLILLPERCYRLTKHLLKEPNGQQADQQTAQ